MDKWPNLIGCITADSDGQHTPQAITRCKEKLIENTASLILGTRNFGSSAQNDVPSKSKFGNYLTSKVFKFLYGADISDTQTGLRGISAEFMKYLLSVLGEQGNSIYFFVEKQ